MPATTFAVRPVGCLAGNIPKLACCAGAGICYLRDRGADWLLGQDFLKQL